MNTYNPPLFTAVIRVLTMRGPCRMGTLRAALRWEYGIDKSPRALAQSLRTLQHQGLIERVSAAELGDPQIVGGQLWRLKSPPETLP